MNVKQENINIGKLVQNYEKEIYQPTEFQRCADAWTNPTKRGLINSVLDDFYIPPLLFSGNLILDGLQRISCLVDFINDRFTILIDGKKYYFKDLDTAIKNKILDKELIKINLVNDDETPLDDKVQKELFYRINANSIKLNKPELIFTNCNIENRNLITQISTDNFDLNNLAQGKKGKRFSLSYLLLSCLTIIYYRQTGYFDDSSKASIRNNVKNFIKINFDEDTRNDFYKKSMKTIEIMNKIFDNSIAPGKFKVIFSAIFVAFYEEIDSFNSFYCNRDEIFRKMQPIFKKLIEDQQIGGIHYDSYAFFKDRVKWVKEVISEYLIDKKRILSIKEKVKMYYDEMNKNSGVVKCAACGKIIKRFNEIDFDHIYCHTNGGKTEIKNSQILCTRCNRIKGWK